MTASSRIVFALHGALLRSARTPLARVWALAYRVATRAWVAYLARGETAASAYVRGSGGREDWLPGLSDVDVSIVLGEDPAGPGAADRVRARWEELHRRFPQTALLLDYPLIFEQEELRALADSTVLTHGQACYFGRRHSGDAVRILERPGLYGSTFGWRRLAGPERRPPEPARDLQGRLVVGWLELLYWWQWAFPACVGPPRPRTASLCVKLVSEPARIWLWLAYEERARDRDEVLRRTLDLLPEEEPALRLALDLQHSLPDAPDPPLDHVLPALVRMSSRIARLIADAVEGDGTTVVRLAGDELVLPHERWTGSDEASLLPLCDWRSLVWTENIDEAFAVVPGSPADPSALGAAAVAQRYGPYPVLRSESLMLLPAIVRWRTALRALKCPLTDPVSFALAGGSRVARFPEAAGWSARDTASRACAERGAWLHEDRPGEGGQELARLFASARAGLFAEDVDELPMTVTETARRLGARSSGARTVSEEALGHHREWALNRTPPPASAIGALRELVLGLDAFRQPAGLLAVEP